MYQMFLVQGWITGSKYWRKIWSDEYKGGEKNKKINNEITPQIVLDGENS